MLLVLFFASGFAALVYQVLWVRELGLLVGSTAQAAALAIAVFFAGIASGGWFWGRRAPRVDNSLRWFGLLEIGVAVTALGHFLLVDAYHALYPALSAVVGDAPLLEVPTKAAVAATILLPPAFLMGGTLPLMGQHLVRERDRLGTTGSALYAVNTAGSACGALAAGFVLPLALGLRNAYLLAVGLDLAVGLSALVLARGAARTALAPTPVPSPRNAPSPPALPAPSALPALPAALIWIVAFVSGFATLAVEVVWTRLFAQVLQNSAYTYALVLATFLVALALGALVANGLCRLRRPTPTTVLSGLLALSAVVTAASPWLFHEVTDGLAYLGADLDWGGYVRSVAGVAVLVMLLPGIVLGAVLPYLLQTLRAGLRQPGDIIGRLVAVNTTGAILGSLAAGFILLPAAGAWRSLVLVAGVYPVLIAAIALARAPRRRWAVAGPAVAATMALLTLTPTGLHDIRLSEGRGERLIEVREGPEATVAVVGRGSDRLIRVNNSYTLGGSRGLDSERNQTVVPMMLHPDPRSVFYLGMGTGITAGAALAFPVERVVVCELIGDVVALADRHFQPWVNGLFTDDRVTVHAEDGRNCLARSDERYDLVISDLFTPWEAGTGNLYTREHYEIGRDRLLPGGLYVQWIPLYQVSDQEFGVIAGTMDEVFDQVTVWRGDLFPSRSVVALIGRMGEEPLDPTTLVRQGRAAGGVPDLGDEHYEALGLRLYAGNITASGLYADRPRNTDAHPVIEYLAPRTHRQVRSGEARFLVGGERERLYEALFAAVDPERDPYLADLTSEQIGFVLAGQDYSRFALLSFQGRDDAAQPHLERFLGRSPPDAINALSPARHLLDDDRVTAGPPATLDLVHRYARA